MSSSIRRQLKDIQVQADKLISSSPSLEEIMEFGSYSKELKNYLLKNIKEDFIIDKLNEIPDVDEYDSSDKVKTGIFTVISGLVSMGAMGYAKRRREAELALNNVREIRGKFASVEFMYKNSEN